MKKTWKSVMIMIMLIGSFGCTNSNSTGMLEPSTINANDYLVFTNVIAELQQRIQQPDGFHVTVNKPGSNQTIFVNYRNRHDSTDTTSKTGELVNETMIEFNDTLVDMIITGTYYKVNSNEQTTNKLVTINDLKDMDNNMDGITIYDNGAVEIIHDQTMLSLQLSSDDLTTITAYLIDPASHYDGQFHYLPEMDL